MREADRIAEILAGWADRRNTEGAMTPEDVIAGHPDVADQLAARFATLGLLEGHSHKLLVFTHERLSHKVRIYNMLRLKINSRPACEAHP